METLNDTEVQTMKSLQQSNHFSANFIEATVFTPLDRNSMNSLGGSGGCRCLFCLAYCRGRNLRYRSLLTRVNFEEWEEVKRVTQCLLDGCHGFSSELSFVKDTTVKNVIYSQRCVLLRVFYLFCFLWYGFVSKRSAVQVAILHFTKVKATTTVLV